jgi:hypothetical protein
MRCVIWFGNETYLVMALGLAVLVASAHVSSSRAWPICMVGLCLMAMAVIPWLTDQRSIIFGVGGFLLLIVITIFATLPRSSREDDEIEISAGAGPSAQQ